MSLKIIEIKPPENLRIERSVAPDRELTRKLWWRWLNITHYTRMKANG